MLQERVEEYLGAIYRLRADPETPVPLSELTGYFGFSPVSVHEMVQKLDDRGLLKYHPYRGATLTEDGEAAARALILRHRLWERFLTDVLHMDWEEAHAIAGRLEHAVSETVTERLADFLGGPDACPHGASIPPGARNGHDQCLREVRAGTQVRVVRISPETPELLRRAKASGLVPGATVRVLTRTDTELEVAVAEAEEGAILAVPDSDARSVWVEVL